MLKVKLTLQFSRFGLQTNSMDSWTFLVVSIFTSLLISSGSPPDRVSLSFFYLSQRARHKRPVLQFFVSRELGNVPILKSCSFERLYACPSNWNVKSYWLLYKLGIKFRQLPPWLVWWPGKPAFFVILAANEPSLFTPMGLRENQIGRDDFHLVTGFK